MQKLIIKTATEHFFKYGFKNFTMDDLAHKLGMSKKTLYGYYASKSDLVQACLDELLNELEDNKCFTQGNGNVIKNVFDSLHAFVEKYQMVNACPIWDLKKYYPKQHEHMRKRFRKIDYEFGEELINKGITEGLFRTNIDKEFTKAFFHGMGAMKEDPEIFPESQFSFWEVIQKEMQYFIRILVNEKGMKELEKILENKDDNL